MKIVLEDGATTTVMEEEEFVYAMIQLFQLWIVSMVDFAKITKNVDQKENVQPIIGLYLVKSK